MNNVYVLKCPLTDFIRYVGITNNPKRRMYEQDRPNDNTNKFEWVKSLKEKGLNPVMQVLESGLDRITACKKEIQYIAMFRALGFPLFNISNGGDAPPSQKGKRASIITTQKLILNSPFKKPVYQYDKQGNLIAEFIGVREACRQTKIDHRSIAQVAGGSLIRKTAGNFIWTYTKK